MPFKLWHILIAEVISHRLYGWGRAIFKLTARIFSVDGMTSSARQKRRAATYADVLTQKLIKLTWWSKPTPSQLAEFSFGVLKSGLGTVASMGSYKLHQSGSGAGSILSVESNQNVESKMKIVESKTGKCDFKTLKENSASWLGVGLDHHVSLNNFCVNTSALSSSKTFLATTWSHAVDAYILAVNFKIARLQP